MKTKKVIVFFIILTIIFSLFVNCFATDETENLENQEQNQQNNTQNEENPANTNAEEEQNNENEGGNTPASTPSNNSSNRNTGNNTNNEQTKSDNANLQSLTLDVEGLSPAFNKNTIEYYLVVSLEVEEIKIDAVPEDNKSTVTVSGNKNLIEGENKVQIAVKAENGNTKVYTIMVIRSNETEEMNANLESLSIIGFDFYPGFKRNIYNYNLTINKKVDKLEINAKTEIEEATFVIEGNENLEEGENIIKVIVTARDGETVKEYRINAFISSKTAEPFKMNTKQAYVLIGALGVAIVVTAVFVFKKKKY